MKNWLENKLIVLSGASGGIGRELCKIFINTYGARVLGVGRREEKMASLLDELGDKKDNFSYRLFDVSKKENWAALVKQLKESGQTPTLLINNAGTFPIFARTIEIGTDTIERVMQVNYFSAVYACDRMLSAFSDLAVVNVCSSSALCSVVGTAAYSASKKAMQGYTEALQMEEKGRYVGIVYPGTTATELFRNDENTQNSALDKVAMPAEKMAKKIAGVIVKRKKRAVVGWDAKGMNLAAKLMPVKGLALIAWVMEKSKSKVFKKVFKQDE